MPTLIVAGSPPRASANGPVPSAGYDQRISAAALDAGWSVIRSSRDCVPTNVPEPVVYVTTELAVLAARTLDIALLEPPFDLLTRVPGRFLRRAVGFATFADLTRLQKRTFVKPADPLDKWFDAGLYANARDIRTCGALMSRRPGSAQRAGRVVGGVAVLCAGRACDRGLTVSLLRAPRVAPHGRIRSAAHCGATVGRATLCGHERPAAAGVCG
ncbi:hypothetical protein GobsT_07890 [Gemmata obscuriglobus]|nr:hypothetical protein GobsT_07890 [Gemmata obscuriglobus]VTS00445.1 Uncharacterized protein OS=Acaryochloris marina (strain MBIC 11017) GN=AM1_2447 PE=4 SV=1 [Gemmata obscuriglobus UQM 2246]